MQTGFGNRQSAAVPATTPTISSGTSAPATTPGKVGDIFVDTSTPKMYIAKGTTNSSDWVAVN